MKSFKAAWVLAALAVFFDFPLRAEIDAEGIEDACAASVLLERSGIPSQVVVADGEAGCLYMTDGVQYLYTTRGSARTNPAHLDEIAPQSVPRAAVEAIGADRREIRNGCLVFATCAYADYEHDSHIVWGGIVAAQIVAATDGYAGAPYYGGLNGHTLTAFETDKQEVFLQENGEAPRKIDYLTDLAQRGECSWCDSDTLAYCDHHIQGFTSFISQFGHPILGLSPPQTNVSSILEALANFSDLSAPIVDSRDSKVPFTMRQEDFDLFPATILPACLMKWDALKNELAQLKIDNH